MFNLFRKSNKLATPPNDDVYEPKRWPCVELTIDFTYKDFVIRLWLDRTNPDYNYESPEQVVAYLRDGLDALIDSTSREIIHEFIARGTPFLNAVQIIDSHSKEGVKIGKVIYTVDFDYNYHG